MSLGFLPFDRMNERVERAREDSDMTFFSDLLLFGEMLTKTVAAGLVAAMGEDQERHKYLQVYNLVRAGGVGTWSDAIDEILSYTGKTAQLLPIEVRNERNELTQKHKDGEWQYDAVALMHKCLKAIGSESLDLPNQVSGRMWFSYFSTFRNKTKGHGALLTSVCCPLGPDLYKSILILCNNYSLFERPWAYLRRNLHYAYRVTSWSRNTTSFDYLKRKSGAVNLPHFEDGVYVHFGYSSPSHVELIESDPDARDFFYPNGSFKDNRFETLSYITGENPDKDGSKYSRPASSLPQSDTQGLGEFDVQGKGLGNLPPQQPDYIERKELEEELYRVLMDDRHPIVSLRGRGGIGKTWLALTVLHRISEVGKFEVNVWFSARDIDLLPEGPKPVAPHVVTLNEIADEYTRLVKPPEFRMKDFRSVDFFAEQLNEVPTGFKPTLFVFDNFETIEHPMELYKWIDAHVRLPNKVLITTRRSDFKADYPLEVRGMTEEESGKLIDVVSGPLGLHNILDKKVKSELYHESDGHPYVIKILLGEMAKSQKFESVERIVAGKGEILEALFERTYTRLSPVANRVFLTLCNWRSTIPKLALEAVLLSRPESEKMDVEEGIDELVRSSLVEIMRSEADKQIFITVPLAAAQFGSSKLRTSVQKSAIETDTQLLRMFGAAQKSDIRHGFGPRIQRLFKYISDLVSKKATELDKHLPMLELIARNYTPAWLLIATLYEERPIRDFNKAKNAIRTFLEKPSSINDQLDAWKRLANLCRITVDWEGEAQALVERCLLPDIPFAIISYTANRINQLFRVELSNMEVTIKERLARPLVDAMEKRIEEADGVDCSRVAWLCMNMHDQEQAKKFCNIGLEKEPDNDHCLKLLEKIVSWH